jgi:hypothetical protein
MKIIGCDLHTRYQQTTVPGGCISIDISHKRVRCLNQHTHN